MTERDQERVSELVIDEWIWIIFIVLSILNISGDEIEKNYCYYHEQKDKERSKKIFIFTVFVSLMIYLYLAYNNCKKYRVAKEKNEDLSTCGMRRLASILVVIAAGLYLYAHFKDTQPVNPSIE